MSKNDHKKVWFIEPAEFLTHVFACDRSRWHYTVRELRRIRDYLVEACSDLNLVIGWTRDEVLHAMWTHSQDFEYLDDSIFWRRGDTPRSNNPRLSCAYHHDRC